MLGTHVIAVAATDSWTTTDSLSVTVRGLAANPAFTPQPAGGNTGVAFGTQPSVSVEDGSGTVVTADNSTSITRALNGGGGGTLTCTGGLTKTVASGVAGISGGGGVNAGVRSSLLANASAPHPPRAT